PTQAELKLSDTSFLEIDAVRDRLLASLLDVLAAFPDHAARRQLILLSAGTTLTPQVLLDQARAAERLGDRPDRPRRPIARSEEKRQAAEASQRTFELWSRSASDRRGALTNDDIVAKAVERNVAIIPVSLESLDRETSPQLDQRGLSITGLG